MIRIFVLRGLRIAVVSLLVLVAHAAGAAVVWNKAYAEWFPKGPSDPELVFIKVLVEEAEYWDPTVHRMVRLRGFLEPTASIRDAEPGTGI